MLSKASCTPDEHDWHSAAVLSSPMSIVTFVAREKCGSKKTSTSPGGVSLANRFASTDNERTPFRHCEDHRVTKSLLLAFASQK